MKTEVIIPPVVKRRSAQSATLIVAGLLCILYGTLSTRAYRAAFLAEHRSLEQAARLEPSDAEYRYSLGLDAARSLDLDNARRDYETALRLNPRMPGAWLDYAYALRASGDTSAARAALNRAIVMAPVNSGVEFEAASAELAMGDRQNALALFHTLLQQSPDQAGQIIELCWRALPDTDSLAGALLGPDAASYRQFLAFLYRRNAKAAAESLFQRYLLSNAPYDGALVSAHVSYLIDQHEIDSASAAWDAAVRHFPYLAQYRKPDNLIFDPSFEAEPLNGGFSWRFQEVQNLSFAIDRAHAVGGHKSLAVIFDGAAGRNFGLTQFVQVQPGRRYTLAFSAMAKDLDSEGSPRISVLDAITGERLAASADLWQWNEWHTQSVTFNTGSSTHLVQLTLDRAPSVRELTGRLWLDAFSLR